ncbi:MAG: SDR family oxidoreductase, partial [Anaerolineaceae bacterium]|nr:SDR family oxidoreductase [Anaerolineaceae bacterium]
PLLLMARRKEKMEAMGLPEAILSKVDVNNIDEIRRAVETAEKVYGPVDCLVNNAGILYLGQPWDQDPVEWEKMIQINIMGVLNGIHVVLKDMMARKTGTIINLGSLAGRKTFGLHSVYCGSKFAVHAISEAIRGEVASTNVRIITVAPGATETEVINRTPSKKFQQDWWDGIGGILQPEDIARSILFVYEQPQNVCIREIVVTPTNQPA